MVEVKTDVMVEVEQGTPTDDSAILATLGKTLTVPATVFFNNGVVSVNIEIMDNYDSPLRKMLEGNVVDESKSVVGVYTREIHGADGLPKSKIVFSGLFNFVKREMQDRAKIEDVINLITLRLQDENTINSIVSYLQDKHDNELCVVCANEQKCKEEREKYGSYRKIPKHSYCVIKVTKFFLEQAKRMNKR